MSNEDPAARAATEAANLLSCAGCEAIDNGLIWHAATCPISFRQFVAAALLAAEQRGAEQALKLGKRAAAFAGSCAAKLEQAQARIAELEAKLGRHPGYPFVEEQK